MNSIVLFYIFCIFSYFQRWIMYSHDFLPCAILLKLHIFVPNSTKYRQRRIKQGIAKQVNHFHLLIYIMFLRFVASEQNFNVPLKRNIIKCCFCIEFKFKHAYLIKYVSTLIQLIHACICICMQLYTLFKYF